MNYIQATIINQLNDTCEWAGNVGVRVREGVHNQGEKVRATVIDLGQSCQRTAHQISRSCLDTADRINNFLYENKETIFFIGCCITTAYFAPSLFFPGFFLSLAGRIELSHTFRNLADHYLKDEVNPYKLNPKFDNCIGTLSLGVEFIAAIDTLAVGTIFMTNAWTLYTIPFLGGIIAGNSVAKLGMNLTNFLD